MPLQIRSILVASDLSEPSDEVVRAAARIAAATGAELHAVHVVEPAHLPYPGASEHAREVEEQLAEAQLGLTEQLRRTGTSELARSTRAMSDAAHRAIEERAQLVGADLIVIGPSRGRSIGDRLLGTTADRLIRTSDVGCLVVHGTMRLPLRRVLAPTDLSQSSQLALTEAVAWAAALGLPPGSEEPEPTEVEVVHVVPMLSEVQLIDISRIWVEDRLREQVAAARETVPEGARVRVREEVAQFSAPEDEILRLANAGTDLLVMGTHGRSALGRALVGSVASAVTRRAPCPVLLVPPVLAVAYPRQPMGTGETGTAGERRAHPVPGPTPR